MRRSHQGIHLAASLPLQRLFPLPVHLAKLTGVKIDKLNPMNRLLNRRQRTAVANLVSGSHAHLPYIIYGPPGTGVCSLFFSFFWISVCVCERETTRDRERQRETD